MPLVAINKYKRSFLVLPAMYIRIYGQAQVLYSLLTGRCIYARPVLIPTFSIFFFFSSPLNFWNLCFWFALCLGPLRVLFSAQLCSALGFTFGLWMESLAQMRPVFVQILLKFAQYLSFHVIANTILSDTVFSKGWNQCSLKFFRMERPQRGLLVLSEEFFFNHLRSSLLHYFSNFRVLCK